MPRTATRAGQKKPLTEAQKAALAKGQAARKRNIAARRASRGRQAASSQVASLPSLARDALSRDSQPDELRAPDADESSTASSPSSSPSKPRLSAEEQDRLILDFAMGDEEQPAEEDKKSGGLGSKVAGFLSAQAASPKPTGNQQEDDAQQSAAQWQALGAMLLILGASAVFGEELAPDEKQAIAMAAPICRIIMRHVEPLRNASADSYDVAQFAGAALAYWWSIKPELARRRAERKVMHASVQVSPEPSRADGNISHFDAARGGGQYHQPAAENRDSDVRQDEQRPASSYVGEAIIDDALGIKL